MAVDERTERLFLLVGWNVRRDKLDASQLELFLRRFRERGVAAVNRIEGTAKQGDLHRLWQCR